MTLRETYIDLIYMGSIKRQTLPSKLGESWMWKGEAGRGAEKNVELNKNQYKNTKENWPFPLRFPVLWSTVFKYELMILWISSVSDVMSPFSFLIMLFWIFSIFLLGSFDKGLSKLLRFYKKSSSLSHWLFVLFSLFLFYWFQSSIWLFPAISSSCVSLLFLFYSFLVCC